MCEAGRGARPFGELCDEALARIGPVEPHSDEARLPCSIGASGLLAVALGVGDTTVELALFVLSETPNATADDDVLDDARRLLAGESGPFTDLDRYLASCFTAPVVDPAQQAMARDFLLLLAERGFPLEAEPVVLPFYPRGDVLSGSESRFRGHAVELLVLGVARRAEDLVDALGPGPRFRCDTIVLNLNPRDGSAAPEELEQASAQALTIFMDEGLCGAALEP